MIVRLLTQQIIVLFLMMGLGFLLVKLKLADAADSKLLSVITVYLVVPCVIINAFQIDYSDEIRSGFMLSLGAAAAIHLLLFMLCWLFGKVLKLSIVERASLIYSNAGNLIIPLVTSVLGPEWVIYASGFICVQLIMLWTHGQSLLEGRPGVNWRKILGNTNLISVIVGIALFVAKVKLPVVVSGMLASMSAIIGPISMIMLGMLMAAVDWNEVFLSWRIYLIAFLKMILFPLLVLLMLKFSWLHELAPNGETILLISLLAVITPSATMVVQLAQIFDQDAKYASSINVLTTVICIITMPVMVMIYLA